MISHDPTPTVAASQEGGTSAASLWLVMMKAYRSMQTYVESTMAAMNIGLSDFAIMEALLHKGPMNMSQLGESVLLANPSMTAAVDRLNRQGFVTRQNGTDDKRVRTVDLTCNGRELIARVYAQHEKDLECVMSEVCPGERTRLRTALKSIGLAAKAKTGT